MRRAMAGPRAAAAAVALQRLRAPTLAFGAAPPTPTARVCGGGRRAGASPVSSAAAAAPTEAAAAARQRQASLTLEHPQTSTSTIYDSPALYDDAFGYRTFRSEAAFLLDAYKAYSLSAASAAGGGGGNGGSGGNGGNGGGGKSAGGKSGSGGALPSSVLDIGCGPGGHAIEMALVLPALASVVALDASAAMLKYGRKKAAAAGARVGGAAPGPSARGAALEFVEGDMTSFSLLAAKGGAGAGAGGQQQQQQQQQQQPLRRFDMATCLLGTLSHALTNAAAAAVLRRAAAHLRPGGLLVLELAHPGDLFDGTLLLGEGQPEMWEVPRKHSAPAAAAASGKASSPAAADKGGFGAAAAASKTKPAPAAGKRAATNSSPSTPPENLLVEWGAAGDDFDPLTQVLQRTVTVTALLPEAKDGAKAGAAARAAAARARAEALAQAAAAAVSGENDGDDGGDDEEGMPMPPLPGQAEGEDDPFAGRRGAVVARQVVACRQFTAQEVELLASAAGLDLAAVHGEMRMDVPSLSHEDAYRMVAVMRRPVV